LEALRLRPPARAGGRFAAPRTRSRKNLGFPAIRAMLRPENKSITLKNNSLYEEVTDFCGFFHVNMI
jgi:hypothetical protein